MKAKQFQASLSFKLQL